MSLLKTLSRQSHEPLYEQLAAVISHRIESGELSAGTQLESEADLMEGYGVSRVTVRQAIAVLRRQSKLVTRRGKGTFVAEKIVSQRLDTLKGFYDALRDQGVEPQLELLEFSPDAGRKDKVRPSSADLPVRLKRLYSLDGLPFALVVGYLPPMARKLHRHIAERTIVYDILRDYLGIQVDQADVTIRCERAPAEVTKLLGLKRSDPMLVMNRQSFTNDKTICEAMTIYIVPDRYEFTMRVAGPLSLASAVQPVEAMNL